MNCALCNGPIIEKESLYAFKSVILGEIVIPCVSFEECSICGDRTLSLADSESVIRYVRKKEMEAIRKLPAGELISADEAAEILGVTKQAFSKNPKIKRGFIFSINVGKRTLYFKNSVLKFKDSGDGRLQLSTSWGKVIKLVHSTRKPITKGDWSVNIGSNHDSIIDTSRGHDETKNNGYAALA